MYENSHLTCIWTRCVAEMRIYMYMEETRYSISDAAKKVNVETHVIRYWEEELELPIPRNELGHRYFTEDTIHMLNQVKELKEYGYQLKAIKMILPKLKDMDDNEFRFLKILSDEMNRRASDSDGEGDSSEKAKIEENEETTKMKKGEEESEDANEQVPSNVIRLNPTATLEQDEKMEQFQRIMTDIVKNALIQSQNVITKDVSNDIGDRVSERILKEMDYEMRRREEQDEEHFRKLDAVLRQYQGAGQEVAASGRKRKKRQKRGFFRGYEESGN